VDGVGGFAAGEVRKDFFFEKKKQKTFADLAEPIRLGSA
jgi:hypothetical protein